MNNCSKTLDVAWAHWLGHRPSTAQTRLEAHLKSLGVPVAPLEHGGADAAGLGPVGLEVLRHLLTLSETGLPQDPVVDPELLVPDYGTYDEAELEAATGPLSVADIEAAFARAMPLFEVLALGFVGWRKHSRHGLWPTAFAFERFDPVFVGTDPYADAVALATALRERIWDRVALAPIAAALGWSARRLNPALGLLIKAEAVVPCDAKKPTATLSGEVYVTADIESVLAAAGTPLPAAPADEPGDKLFETFVDLLRKEVKHKLARTELTDVTDRFCLSARLKGDSGVVLGAFTGGTPPWATDPAHEYHRADTVYLELGDACAVPLKGHLPDRLRTSKDELVRHIARLLARKITALPG